MPPGKRSSSTLEELKGSSATPSTDANQAKRLLSPLKRLKCTMEQRVLTRAPQQVVVLPTVEEFRTYVLCEEIINVDRTVSVVVRGTLLWKSEHVVNDRTLVHLHFTDAEPEDSAEELQEFEIMHGVDEAHRVAVDSVLLTVTVFDETLASQTLPLDGRVVRIRNSRRRAVSDGKYCQLVTRAVDMTME